MDSVDDFHCFRSDPQVRWQGIAQVLETDSAAWDWALANIERWLAQRRLHAAPLMEWRKQLLDARDEAAKRQTLLASLRRPPADAHQGQLRSCSPFVGGPFQPAASGSARVS